MPRNVEKFYNPQILGDYFDYQILPEIVTICDQTDIVIY